ncbi:MAG TPA: M67 family metallopeptidase [Rhizomicrobium sp.]|nr:M67 family metallopeptidase [Rhizomicrobium sp.]
MTAVLLAPAHRAQIEAEARAALPRECCGLIEGWREGAVIRVRTVHAVRNLSEAADRFDIDPAEHVRLLRAARERGSAIVGCYHSHPDGRAEPSPRDLAGAADENFLWLIAASTGDAVQLRGFLFRGGGFAPVELGESA